MSKIITSATLTNANSDLVAILLDMMQTTHTKAIRTFHGVTFDIENGKLCISGPEYDVNYELMIAIDDMKSEILGRMM